MRTQSTPTTSNRQSNNISASALSLSNTNVDRFSNHSIQYTNCKWDLKPADIDTPEKKEKFQNDPGLYGVLFGTKKCERNESIISFAYVDCSVLAVEGGLLTGRSQVIHGLLFELTVSVTKPFLKKDEIDDLEILTLDFKRLVTDNISNFVK